MLCSTPYYPPAFAQIYLTLLRTLTATPTRCSLYQCKSWLKVHAKGQRQSLLHYHHSSRDLSRLLKQPHPREGQRCTASVCDFYTRGRPSPEISHGSAKKTMVAIQSSPIEKARRSYCQSKVSGTGVQQYRGLHDQPDTRSLLEQHRAEVDRIAAAVRDFHERGQPFRIDHGSTNSTRKGALGRDPRKTVNTSGLNRVLQVDAERQTVLAEPNVSMDRLIEATLAYGLIPLVVMEFPGITVGGGYAGTSGESSSFRHGFFNRTLNSVEIVLADGEVVVCSADKHADLFHGAAGAIGTLGVTTLVEIQLRKAAQYVETTYHPVISVADAIEKLQRFTAEDSEFDYVDGILYSPHEGAVITGRLTDTPASSLPIQRFSSPKEPWFYLHVRDRITSSPSTPIAEAIPLPEYLFRYDRGCFWVGAEPFQYFRGVPFNSWTRRFLDDFLHTRMLYAALHGSGQAERLIAQDLALPYETAEQFIDFNAQDLGIWPLWLCPLKQSPHPTMHPHYDGSTSSSSSDDSNPPLPPMLNIGLWGSGAHKRMSHETFVRVNRTIEGQLRELKGMKWLYAQTFCSEKQFWQDFDRQWYDALREKYHATSLPSVYDKVRAAPDDLWEQEDSAVVASTSSPDNKKTYPTRTWRDIWPISGIIGLRRAIQSKHYLLERNASWKNWVPR